MVLRSSLCCILLGSAFFHTLDFFDLVWNVYHPSFCHSHFLVPSIPPLLSFLCFTRHFVRLGWINFLLFRFTILSSLFTTDLISSLSFAVLNSLCFALLTSLRSSANFEPFLSLREKSVHLLSIVPESNHESVCSRQAVASRVNHSDVSHRHGQQVRHHRKHICRGNKQTVKQTVKQTNSQTNSQTSKQSNKQTVKQANKQTNSQTSKQTNSQTNKQSNKQTNSQTNKQSNKQSNKQTNAVILGQVSLKDSNYLRVVQNALASFSLLSLHVDFDFDPHHHFTQGL